MNFITQRKTKLLIPWAILIEVKISIHDNTLVLIMMCLECLCRRVVMQIFVWLLWVSGYKFAPNWAFRADHDFALLFHFWPRLWFLRTKSISSVDIAQWTLGALDFVWSIWCTDPLTCKLRAKGLSLHFLLFFDGKLRRINIVMRIWKREFLYSHGVCWFIRILFHKWALWITPVTWRVW